jgi:hypothetical protein
VRSSHSRCHLSCSSHATSSRPPSNATGSTALPSRRPRQSIRLSPLRSPPRPAPPTRRSSTR